MPSRLTTDATEDSTYAITAAFLDDESNAVSPDTATWTLTDTDGNVINSREDVAISSPSSSETIVLSGDDLQIVDADDDGMRRLTIEATYTSNLGSGLPLKDSIEFKVVNLVAVT